MPTPEYHNPDDPIDTIGTVGEFWRWAMSDLLGNRNRGIFAEYLVGLALGERTLEHPRMEWDCYDLVYRGKGIEVKSSAYIQTWHRSRDRRSILSFTVAQSRCWDARTDTYSSENKRHAHLYVFCVFPASREQYTRDVLDLKNWLFYVTTTANLERYIQPETKTIGITKVREICGEGIQHQFLKVEIDRLLAGRS